MESLRASTRDGSRGRDGKKGRRRKKRSTSPKRRSRDSLDEEGRRKEMLQSPFYRRQLLKHMTASTKNEMLLASRRRYQRQGGGSFPATIFKVRVTGHNEMFEPLYTFDVEFDNGAVERFVDEARVLPREDAPESSTKGGGDRDSGGRRKQKQQAFFGVEGAAPPSVTYQVGEACNVLCRDPPNPKNMYAESKYFQYCTMRLGDNLEEKQKREAARLAAEEAARRPIFKAPPSHLLSRFQQREFMKWVAIDPHATPEATAAYQKTLLAYEYDAQAPAAAWVAATRERRRLNEPLVHIDLSRDIKLHDLADGLLSTMPADTGPSARTRRLESAGKPGTPAVAEHDESDDPFSRPGSRKQRLEGRTTNIGVGLSLRDVTPSRRSRAEPHREETEEEREHRLMNLPDYAQLDQVGLGQALPGVQVMKGSPKKGILFDLRKSQKLYADRSTPKARRIREHVQSGGELAEIAHTLSYYE